MNVGYIGLGAMGGARQFTVVVPSGKLAPEAGVQVTETPSPVVVGAL